ncbi:MAG: hypothetical protein MZU84_07695 [Sphingobacterium sp.]|nr:hypothetical protein [Sphingobacterium sp.]
MDNWFVGASIGAIPVGILTAILLGTGVGVPIIGGAILLGEEPGHGNASLRETGFFDQYKDHLRQLLDAGH